MILRQATALFILALALHPAPARAQSTLSDENVLVVYNSAVDENAGGGGQMIFERYRTLPDRDQVIGFDLNDATLLPGNVSYADFKAKIRDPIRAYLINNNLTQQVLVITLTRGIPTRIAGISEGAVPNSSAANLDGDNPSTASTQFIANNMTFASVDSELALLYQDLDSGESGGAFDSPADNYIRNPFFNSTDSITASDRTSVQTARRFAVSGSYWQLRALIGRRTEPTDTRPLFLTCRLDGQTVSGVKAALNRAQRIFIDPDTDHFIIDEFEPSLGGPGQGEDGDVELDAGGLSPVVRTLNTGGDFDQLAADLTAEGFSEIDYDQSSTFLTGQHGSIGDPSASAISGPVAAIITFGGNHSSQNQNGFLGTFVDPQTGESQFVNGAYYVGVESYAAREFGGLPQFGDQGSVSEFIAAGGTFGLGNVFEPFTIGISEADIMIDRHLQDGWTFIEAAFASVPFISSELIVVGDPLAKVTIGPRPVPIDFTVDLAAKISFPTEAGVFYSVFKSSDGRRFVPFATVEGTGAEVSVVDTENLQPSMLYKVEVQ